MRKTIFSKIFSANLISVIVLIISLAVCEYTLIHQYIYREQVNVLKKNASVIAEFIQKDSSVERLDNFLYGFSESSNQNIILIDKERRIIMSSADEEEINREMMYVPYDVCKDVLTNKETLKKGNLGGIYKSDMYTLQVPILFRDTEQVIGAVFISTAVPEMTHMQIQIFKIILTSMVFVFLLSFIMSFAVSKSISGPIKKIGNAAKKFAKGDFSSRVKINNNKKNVAEIYDLTQTFNDMAYELEQADNIKKNFISDVSHELRTPMTTIGGFIDGILDDTIPPERQKEYLNIVKDEVARLSALVNSFLDITRMRDNKVVLEMTDFDINEMIRRTLINLESKIEEKNISVEVEFETGSCIVNAEKDSIRRVLTNLLDNAIKFTEKMGEIRVKVYSKQQEVFVSVRNTGCGIPDDEQKFIFERFYKVDRSRSINKTGTGIGLYIVKDILNRHKKDIKVKSVEGEYAEFTFSLNRGKN